MVLVLAATLLLLWLALCLTLLRGCSRVSRMEEADDVVSRSIEVDIDADYPAGWAEYSEWPRVK